MRVKSREYKVIVDGAFFADPDEALDSICKDLREIGRFFDLKLAGEFDAARPKERTVCFLDTPDGTLRRNGLLFRQRVQRKNGKTEYTLKCRSEDRYIAAGEDLAPAPGLDHEKRKFEEDVGVPFVSRFSHSETVRLSGHHRWSDRKFPSTLAEAGELFPRISAVRYDDRACPSDTALMPVNGRKVFERVFVGPVLHFGQERNRRPLEASVAMIVWSKADNARILTAEFSFRYEDEQEAYCAKVASAARRVFDHIQQQAWARPDALTKTQYMYEGN